MKEGLRQDFPSATLHGGEKRLLFTHALTIRGKELPVR